MADKDTIGTVEPSESGTSQAAREGYPSYDDYSADSNADSPQK